MSVNVWWVQKLMAWYNHQGKVVSRTETSKEIQKLMLNQSAAVVKPRRVAPLRMYQRLHYGTRIKKKVDEEWLTERVEVVAAGADAKGQKKAQMLSRDRVTEELWDMETEEFRQEILQLREEDFEAQLEEKRANESNPETADDYQR